MLAEDLLGELALLLLFASVSPSPPVTSAAGGAVNTSAIPAAYVPWVLQAGSLCAEITPAIIAVLFVALIIVLRTTRAKRGPKP